MNLESKTVSYTMRMILSINIITKLNQYFVVFQVKPSYSSINRSKETRERSFSSAFLCSSQLQRRLQVHSSILNTDWQLLIFRFFILCWLFWIYWTIFHNTRLLNTVLDSHTAPCNLQACFWTFKNWWSTCTGWTISIFTKLGNFFILCS